MTFIFGGDNNLNKSLLLDSWRYFENLGSAEKLFIKGKIVQIIRTGWFTPIANFLGPYLTQIRAGELWTWPWKWPRETCGPASHVPLSVPEAWSKRFQNSDFCNCENVNQFGV